MSPLPRRDLRNLVRKLGADSRPSQKRQALATILSLCHIGDVDRHSDIVAAGAIPALVHLLGHGSPAEVQESAAEVLGTLADYAGNTIAVAIADAGAIPLLVQLLGPDSPDVVHETTALMTLAANSVAIAAAGAIPSLVRLLGPGSSAMAQQGAVGALGNLSSNAENAALIVAAGAIPAVVRLLGPGSTAPVQRRNHAATETRLSGLETALGGLGSGYGRMNAEVIRLGLGLTAMEERTAGHEALVREDTKARQVQYSRDLASRASKDELGAHAAAQQRDTAALRDEIRQAAGMGPTGNVRAAIIAERRETRCNRMFKVIIPQRVTDRPLELADKLHTWLIRPELLGKPPPAAGPLVFEDAWVLRPKGGETSSQEGTKAAFVVASPLLARWVHSRLAAVSAAGVSISVERTPAQQQAWLPLKALFAQAMQEGRKGQCKRGQGRQHCSFRYTICSSSCNS
ncbi:hypothetical protein FOA52_016022 [Chlamydomonas sp. UWO 241]|nr:hypothetical protein FOA52_016022 [Chlamydomonas sp. UWO 241]